jgi:hypothetical protein
MKVLGMKMNTIILIGVIVVAIWYVNMYSCSRVSLTEGMQLLGSELGYKMGQDIKGSWDTREQKKGSSIEWREQDHDAYPSKFVDPSKDMFYFSQTEFRPDCCGSTYSSAGNAFVQNGHSSGGCACMNKQQIHYLNTRGGNRVAQTGEW